LTRCGFSTLSLGFLGGLQSFFRCRCLFRWGRNCLYWWRLSIRLRSWTSLSFRYFFSYLIFSFTWRSRPWLSSRFIFLKDSSSYVELRFTFF
jgi:hypothetical protein